MRVTKISAPVYLSKEAVSLWGDRSSPAGEVEKYLQRARERRARIDAALKAAPESLQPIIELHSPTSGDECRGCDAGAYAESGADWPCSTLALIIGEDACA